MLICSFPGVDAMKKFGKYLILEDLSGQEFYQKDGDRVCLFLEKKILSSPI